jgi:hypothetical protein
MTMRFGIAGLALMLASAGALAQNKTVPVTIVGQSDPVTVTGMVAVAPSSTPTPVTISAQSTPVPVAPVPAPSMALATRYQKRFSGSWTASGPASSYVFFEKFVPAGKYLVIERIGAVAFTPAGERVYVQVLCEGGLLGSPGIGSASISLPLVSAGVYDGRDTQTLNDTISCFADARTQIYLNRNSSAPAGSASVTIIGYLMDLPST